MCTDTRAPNGARASVCVRVLTYACVRTCVRVCALQVHAALYRQYAAQWRTTRPGLPRRLRCALEKQYYSRCSSANGFRNELVKKNIKRPFSKIHACTYKPEGVPVVLYFLFARAGFCPSRLNDKTKRDIIIDQLIILDRWNDPPRAYLSFAKTMKSNCFFLVVQR